MVEVSRLLVSEASLDEVSDRLLGYACDLTGSRSGFLGLIDPETRKVAAGVELPPRGTDGGASDEDGWRSRVGAACQRALEEGAPLMANEAAGPLLVVPIATGDSRVGVIALAGSGREYTKTDLALTESLGRSYALTVERHTAQAELQRAKDFTESIIETADAMMVMRDLRGGIRMFNRAAEEVTGYRREEVMGCDWFEVIVPRERYPEAWHEFVRFGEGSGSLREPYASPVLTASGEERFINWRTSEVREDGRVTGLISIGSDITERCRAVEELRESEEKYRTLFESSSDGIFIVSLNGTILDCNRRSLDMSGYEREELVGRPVSDFIKAEALLENPDLAGYIAALGAASVETSTVRKDGEEARVEIVSRVIRLRGEEVIIGYVRDVSESRRREKELQELNVELRAFASTLSHDLKTPLGSALGYAATLRRLYSDRLDETGREGLDVLVGSLERINGIIEGMLEYTRAGRRGGREEEEAVVGLIVEGIAGELRDGGMLDGVDLSIAGDLPVATGDSLKIYQVLLNLISNAAKFTAGRPEAAVEVGCLRRGGHDVVYVKDNGPGIPPEYLDRIFEPLARLDAARNVAGHGLGLAIVKRAVESWGGRVWAKSHSGRGSTFFFTLP